MFSVKLRSSFSSYFWVEGEKYADEGAEEGAEHGSRHSRNAQLNESISNESLIFRKPSDFWFFY